MRDIIIPLGWDSNRISFESHHIESHPLFIYLCNKKKGKKKKGGGQ